MDALEPQIIAQATDGSDTLGWLILLSVAVGGLLLWLAIKTFRVDGKTTPVAKGVSLQDAIDPNLLVVLTAAATAALGTPVVVRRITFLDSKTVSGWAEVGRTALHWSHNLPRNP